jgi:DNA-binding CsgD family transcriptional regulator
MHVPLDALRRAAQLLDSLEDLDQPAEAPDLIISGVAGMVGCDVVTYNEIAMRPDQLSYYADYPPGALDWVSVETFEVYLHEHPLLIHYRATGESAPVKISDFLSRRRFHQLALYSEFYRHVPVEDQIALNLPATGDGQVIAIALNRGQKDFTEADRDVLGAIAGPLNNAVRRGRRRYDARTAIATAGSDGLGELTGRELQVLELAAKGRTNRAIASAVGVSPRTVAKHLEHIYRKLGVTNRAAAVYTTTAAGRANGPPAGPPR